MSSIAEDALRRFQIAREHQPASGVEWALWTALRTCPKLATQAEIVEAYKALETARVAEYQAIGDAVATSSAKVSESAQ